MTTRTRCTRVAAVLGWAAIACAACGAELRTVPRGPHPAGTPVSPIAIDRPPPSAQIENVSAAPAEGCLWNDGAWSYVDGDWQWTAGKWVKPGRCFRADGSPVWVASPRGVGQLFFTPRQWYDRDTQAPCAAPPPCGPPS